MLKINIKENEKMNISQNSELTEQDSAKKRENAFIFPSESQKIESNLNDKQDNKKAGSMGVEGDEKVINIINPIEKTENNQASFLDAIENKNIVCPINNDDAIGESGEKEASNISSNRRNHNIPYFENPFQANSTNYIIIGIKDT